MLHGGKIQQYISCCRHAYRTLRSVGETLVRSRRVCKGYSHNSDNSNDAISGGIIRIQCSGSINLRSRMFLNASLGFFCHWSKRTACVLATRYVLLNFTTDEASALWNFNCNSIFTILFVLAANHKKRLELMWDFNRSLNTSHMIAGLVLFIWTTARCNIAAF